MVNEEKLREVLALEEISDSLKRIVKAFENFVLKDTAREIVTTLKDEEMTIDEDSDMRITEEILNEPKKVMKELVRLNEPKKKEVPIEKEQEIPKPDISSGQFQWWNVKDGKVRHCNDCQLFLKYDKDTGKYVHGKVDFDKRIWYFVSLKCEKYGG